MKQNKKETETRVAVDLTSGAENESADNVMRKKKVVSESVMDCSDDEPTNTNNKMDDTVMIDLT